MVGLAWCGLLTTSSSDAELVALRVLHYRVVVGLVVVGPDMRGAQVDQSARLSSHKQPGRLLGRPRRHANVEMHSVLDDLRFWDAMKEHGRPDLLRVHHHAPRLAPLGGDSAREVRPADVTGRRLRESVLEHLGPKGREPVRIFAVDGHLDPSRHAATIRSPAGTPLATSCAFDPPVPDGWDRAARPGCF